MKVNKAQIRRDKKKAKELAFIKRFEKNCISKHASKIRRNIWAYKRSAKLRGMYIELTDEDLGMLFFKPCYYCGLETGMGGIDRLDNTKGYLYTNCVSCCKQCNYAKKATVYEDFVAWILRVGDRIREGKVMTDLKYEESSLYTNVL